MSDQPKSMMTRDKSRSLARRQRDSALARAANATTQPKPTSSEWTVEWLRQYLSGYSSYDLQLKAIADAHNAALAAERDNTKEARAQREWLIKECERIGITVNVQIGAPITEAYRLENTQLAAEREKQLVAAQAAKKQAAQFLREGVKPLQVAGYLDTSDTTALDSAIAQQLRDQLASERGKGRMRVDALEWAFTIIANAGGGDWQRESKEWQDAAAKWRDEAWHPAIANVGK